jgi:hypothetical protein
MSSESQRIVSLIAAGGQDRKGITTMVRILLETGREDELADVALQLSKGKDPLAKNNHLSVLRVIIRRVCESLKRPLITVKESGRGYRVATSFPTARAGRNKDASVSLEALAQQSAHLPLPQRVALLERVMRALNLLQST